VARAAGAKAWRSRARSGQLRAAKEPLGDLVSLEMGKIRAEGTAKCRR
jgi:hypothetical protein